MEHNLFILSVDHPPTAAAAAGTCKFMHDPSSSQELPPYVVLSRFYFIIPSALILLSVHGAGRNGRPDHHGFVRSFAFFLDARRGGGNDGQSVMAGLDREEEEEEEKKVQSENYGYGSSSAAALHVVILSHPPSPSLASGGGGLRNCWVLEVP